ncbi:hypothetical protein HDU99_009400, partial [Rhizoclosmatium hyalinum]
MQTQPTQLGKGVHMQRHGQRIGSGTTAGVKRVIGGGLPTLPSRAIGKIAQFVQQMELDEAVVVVGGSETHVDDADTEAEAARTARTARTQQARRAHNLSQVLCVSRHWLRSAAAQLWRHVRVRSLGLESVVSALLAESPLVPYAAFVRRVTLLGGQVEIGDIDLLLLLAQRLSSLRINLQTASNVLLLSIADYCPRLSHLVLRECPLSAPSLLTKMCLACPLIRNLDLSYTLFDTEAAVIAVTYLPALQSLIVEGLGAPLHSEDSSTSTSTTIQSTAKNKSLKYVSLRNSLPTDSHIRRLAQTCPSLQTLIISSCTSLSDDAILSIAQFCPLLETLDASFIPSLTDLSLYALSHRLSSSLYSLSLSSCTNISPLAVQFLIDACLSESSGVASAEPNSFTRNGRLHQLVMHGCPLILQSYLGAFDTKKDGFGVTFVIQESPADAQENASQVENQTKGMDGQAIDLLEWMLVGEELRAAVGAGSRQPTPSTKPTLSLLSTSNLQPNNINNVGAGASSNGGATATSPRNDYTLEPNELWMLAAYNMRILNHSAIAHTAPATNSAAPNRVGTSNNLFDSLDSLTDSEDTSTAATTPSHTASSLRNSNRSSFQSLGDAQPAETNSSNISDLTSKELKRLSSLSVASSVSSTTSSTRLPTPTPSRLPSSRLRQSTSMTNASSSLPKPASSLSKRTMQQQSTPTPITSKTPTPTPTRKINFSAYHNTPTQPPPPVTRSFSGLKKPTSLLTLSSYTTPLSPPTSASTTTSSYKPRTFKKYNEDAAEVSSLLTPRKPGTAVLERTTTKPVRSTTTITTTTPVKGIGSALKRPASGVSPGSGGVTPVRGASTYGSSNSSGLKPPMTRRQTIIAPVTPVSSPGSGSGMMESPVTGGLSLDKWRAVTPPPSVSVASTVAGSGN